MGKSKGEKYCAPKAERGLFRKLAKGNHLSKIDKIDGSYADDENDVFLYSEIIVEEDGYAERETAFARRQGRKRGAQRKKRKRAFIVVGAVAALLITVIGSVVLFINGKLNRLSYDMVGADSTKTVHIKADNEKVSIDLDAYELREGSGEIPDGEVVSDEEIYNILIIGSDMRIPGTEDRGRADLVMLASLNVKEPVLKLASFERAMGMPVQGQKDVKLNDLLNVGGAVLIEDTIDKCFLTDTMGYIHIDYDSFKVIVDAIGGVDIEMDALEASHYNGRITMDVRSEYVATEGINHLGGYEALVYCRLRNSDDNWSRQGRTRLVMEAAVKKVLGMSLSEINALADELLPLVHTNLTKKQITTLMMQLPKLIGLTAEQNMFPDKEKIWVYHGEQNEAMFGCDFAAESERLQQYIYG